jgi:hypothetical protein
MGTRAPAHACLHHWYKGREIQQRYGDVDIRTLRFIYGAGFAPAFYASHALRDVLALLDRLSLDKLLADYEQGNLEAKMDRALAAQATGGYASVTGSR